MSAETDESKRLAFRDAFAKFLEAYSRKGEIEEAWFKNAIDAGLLIEGPVATITFPTKP